jgi:uncharacterized protein (TIGR03000 family)
MSHNKARLAGVLVVGFAIFFLTTVHSLGAGRGGGFHGGGFHAGGFHTGGFHTGGYRGGWYGGGARHYAGGWRGGSGAYRGSWYGRYPYYRGYRPGLYGYGSYPWYGYGSYPWYGYSNYSVYPYLNYPAYWDYPSGISAPAADELNASPDVPVYAPASTPVDGTDAAKDDTARVTVRVPADAQVWFQNQPMAEQGSVRTYQSPRLVPGQTYSYDIRAEWPEGGQVVNKSRHVNVQAGANVSVDFTARAPGQPQPSAGAARSGS